MGIHKGTKLTENPKKHTLNFRYDDETEKKLNYLSKKEKLTKAEIIRKGIDIDYSKSEITLYEIFYHKGYLISSKFWKRGIIHER